MSATKTRSLITRTDERLIQVIAMRDDGLTFSEIGRELGVSRPRAYQLYQKAIKRFAEKIVEELESEQN
jgi:DNA-directed RNA polymerase specialized sigma subunit